MEEIQVEKSTLEQLQGILKQERFLDSNNLREYGPIKQLLELSIHQRGVIDFQNQIINQMRNKQIVALEYLKELEGKIRDDNIGDVIEQLKADLVFKGKRHAKNPKESLKEDAQDSQDYAEALQKHHYDEQKYDHSNNSLSSSKILTPKDNPCAVDSKIQLDPVLAKIVNGDNDLQEIHLLENPDNGFIDAMKDPVTHSYIYREINNILREQRHTITDYMYKLFLVSINFSKIRNIKSYTVFKSLLSRVRLNSCEILLSSALSCVKLKAFLSYLELTAGIGEDSLASDHIPERLKRRLTTNNLKYENYDPAYQKPPGIIGDENDQELEDLAKSTLRKIEVSKPEAASDVPRYIYRIMSVLYACYNKQNGTKISTGVTRSILKCETRICRALVLYTQGKRSKTSLNDMIEELEVVEFSKNMNKKFFR